MSNDTLREELEREFERLIWEKFKSKGGESYTQAKLVALDLLATNRAQAEEIETTLRRLRDMTNECRLLRQERDARTQEAAQAQARVKVLEDALRQYANEDFWSMDGEVFYGPGVNHQPPDDGKIARAALATVEPSPTAALEAVVQRVREEEREKVATPCVWTQDNDGVWHPACGEEHAFYFNEGGPVENKAKFCHACGHPIEVKPYTDEDDRAAGLREGGKP